MQIPGIKVYMQIPPMIRIGGMLTKSQYQYTLQDLDMKELEDYSTRLMNALAHDARLRGCRQRSAAVDACAECRHRP